MTPQLLDPALRDLERLAAYPDVDEGLRDRCRTAIAYLHREPPAGLQGAR